MRTFRELSRLESVTESPILSQLSETLAGTTIIRNFNKEKDFIFENYSKLDENLNAAFWKGSVRRWFTVRLELTGRLIVVITMVMMVREYS